MESSQFTRDPTHIQIHIKNESMNLHSILMRELSYMPKRNFLYVSLCVIIHVVSLTNSSSSA